MSYRGVRALHLFMCVCCALSGGVCDVVAGSTALHARVVQICVFPCAFTPLARLVDPWLFVPSYHMMLCCCSSITWLDGADALDLELTAL